MERCRIFYKFSINIIVFLCLLVASDGQDSSQMAPEGGFLKREYSLTKPYSSNGMTMPFWDFRDRTMLTNNFIRLTSNHQAEVGSVWNKIPLYLRDWEMQVQFKVHGGGRTLGADGFAIWYTKERMTPGPVFGSRDEFHGLGVFFDTYKNGPQAVTFPQITAMVGNGSVKYDHMTDGKSNAIGSCLASFRNKDYDTLVSIKYVKETLQIRLDIDGLGEWRECFSMPGVKLPTGYFIGMSAATGDLADNHDLINVKFFHMDAGRSAEEEAEDWSTVLPGVSYLKPPIDNRDDVGSGDFRNSSVSGFKLFLLVVCILLGVGVCVVVGVVVFQKRQAQNRKRFY
uniref:Vesicular integral-membrane protein VIP36 n=1 Tax=Ciona intestinalis TaxID=7719 RepID=F7B2X5_CIOIN|nr:vesicular integral-membrane protein VIP36 [Ciona intestinalis]|eukprot:XP_002126496.1 vesicular integral-membrane protein VIP36 [Ciona intestinalis]